MSAAWGTCHASPYCGHNTLRRSPFSCTAPSFQTTTAHPASNVVDPATLVNDSAFLDLHTCRGIDALNSKGQTALLVAAASGDAGTVVRRWRVF